MDPLQNLEPEQIDFVNRYVKIHERILTLQTRMHLLETDLNNSIKELEELRELEKKYQQNG